MSNHSTTSHIHSPAGRESMTTATTEKYPASSTSGYQSYPEVAPHQTDQPGLQTYHPQTPHSGYAQPQYQYQNGYPQEAAQPIPPTHKRNPWGMSPLAFGLLVATITAVIVGGAVGGGVAGAMSGKDNDKSSSNNTSPSTVTVTSTATPTTNTDSFGTASALPQPSSLKDYAPAEPLYVDTLVNPGCSDSRIDVQYDESFDLYCGMDMQNNIADDTHPDLMVADVVAIFAYTVTDCLYACANAIHFEELWDKGFAGCKGVTWNYEMAANNASNFANCWLKNGTSSGFQCNTCISGKLVT